MKICSRCGKQLNDDVKICLGCGCPVTTNYTVTFKREKQWFLINPPMNIQITGMNSNCEISVESGETVTKDLPVGNYHIHVYSSARSSDVDLNLSNNITFRLAWNRFSGKLEFWEI